MRVIAALFILAGLGFLALGLNVFVEAASAIHEAVGAIVVLTAVVSGGFGWLLYYLDQRLPKPGDGS